MCDKWCDSNPNHGVSNNHNNITLSLASALPEAEISMLYYDEVMIKHSKHVDTILPFISADVFIFCFLGNSSINPSPHILEKLQGKKIFIWPDTVYPELVDTIKSVNHVANLHVAFDGLPDRSIYPDDLLAKFAGPDINGITPQNPQLFYPEKKEYDICFLGTSHTNRPLYIRKLSSFRNCRVAIGGGQREGKLSPEKYAEVVRRSRMCINLSLSPSGKRQLKGRVMESMASKTCVIEEMPSPILTLLNTNQFIQIKSPHELADIILCKTDGELTEITESAYDVYNSRCSPQAYWKNLLNNID